MTDLESSYDTDESSDYSETSSESYETSLSDETSDDEAQEFADANFPSFPLVLCLKKEDILKIHEPFVEESVIFIKESSICWNDFTGVYDEIRENFMIVKTENGKYVTMMDILAAINDSEFYNGRFKENNEHIFLEGVSKLNGITYELMLGS
jgi:hypothetical protein